MNAVRCEVLAIEDVARRFGIKASALRYYDEVGLLRPTLRRSGRRYYGLAELRRLALIQLLQEVASMSLKDIAVVIGARSDDRAARDILKARMAALKDEIQRVRLAIRYLDHRLDCPRDNPFDDCPVLGREVLDRLADAGLSVTRDESAALLAREIRPQAAAVLATGRHRRRRPNPAAADPSSG